MSGSAVQASHVLAREQADGAGFPPEAEGVRAAAEVGWVDAELVCGLPEGEDAGEGVVPPGLVRLLRETADDVFDGGGGDDRTTPSYPEVVQRPSDRVGEQFVAHGLVALGVADGAVGVVLRVTLADLPDGVDTGPVVAQGFQFVQRALGVFDGRELVVQANRVGVPVAGSGAVELSGANSGDDFVAGSGRGFHLCLHRAYRPTSVDYTCSNPMSTPVARQIMTSFRTMRWGSSARQYQEDGMTTKHEAALRALEELERRATTGVWSAGKPDTNGSNWKLAATIRDALTAQGEAAPANVVGTCDWGDCDGETVGVRLDSDAQWLAVCAQHSPVCRAMDVIWRLTCLPFSDDDRRLIQGIALAWQDGHGPLPGSHLSNRLAALEALAPTDAGGEA